MRRYLVTGVIVPSALVALVANTAAQAPAKPAAQPAPAAAAKPADNLIDGRWEGMVDSPEGTVPAVADLKLADGVITGSMTAGPYSLVFYGGSLEGETVTLTFDVEGAAGTMTSTLKDNVMQGTWSVEGMSGGFTVKRASAAAPAGGTPAEAGPAETRPAAGGQAAPAGTATDLLSGEWDGVADAGGSQVPFTLSLKLDGDKVTGTISSDQGGGPIEGTFKDNTLSFSFLMPSGEMMAMSATLADGKLAGMLDMAGQFQSGWAAAKRK